MTDNELLEVLFQPARQWQVADDGFSRRVMNHLPHCSTRQLSRLWTAFCVAVAVALFVILRGWEPLVGGLLTLAQTPPTVEQLFMVMVSMGVMLLLAVGEIVNRERYSVF